MNSIRQFFADTLPAAPMLLAVIIIAILGIILLVLWLLRSSKKEAQEATEEKDEAQETPQEQPPDEQPPPAAVAPVAAAAPKAKLSGLKLRQSFRKAIKLLKENIPGRNFRYQVPWILMMGEAGCGKTHALDTGGMNLSMEHPFGGRQEVKTPCNWWFFEKGVVLDIAGDLVLGRTGSSANDKLWKLLLRQLQKHRMERPLDAMVVAVSAADFFDGNGNPLKDYTRIAEKADQLYRKIWQAQKTLGMRFPVYILLTQCNRVEGFCSFVRALPNRYARDIFGWSAPYGVSTNYSSEWTIEAFKNIDKELSLLQYELFTEGTDLAESDGIFLFPQNVQALVKPMQVFMDHLFKQGAYHEAFTPRGIYFCGGEATETFDPTAKTFFLQNVFNKKIFPEFGLAHPIGKTLLNRNRKILALQITAVVIALVGCLGLWRSYSRLSSDISEAMPVMKRVVQDAGELGRSFDLNQSDVLYTLLRRESPFADSAQHLLSNMGKLKTYRSFFMPTSWFSSINQNNVKGMTYAFEEIILKGIYFQLHQKAKEIFLKAERGIPQGEVSDNEVNVENMPEFQTLQIFVQELKELEEYIALYNGIRSSESVRPLARLANFCFGINLGEDFFTDSDTYLDALKRSRIKEFDPQIFRLKTKFFTINKLSERLYAGLFNSNDIISYLDALSMQLDDFSKKRRRADEDAERIRMLLETFDKTEQVLQESRNANIFKPAFDLGGAYEDLLAQLEGLQFIGATQINKIREKGENSFNKLQTEIKNKQTELTGYLVARENGHIQNRLSPQALTIRDDLALLLDQEFMVFEKSDGWDLQVSPDQKHRWDAKVLKDTIRLFEPYSGFLDKGITNIPPELRHVVIRMAQDGLENKLMENIAKAWNSTPAFMDRNGRRGESDVLAEIKNFQQASEDLAILLDYFNQLDLMASQRMLLQMLQAQTALLLTALEDYLSEDRLYDTKGGNFSWWDGITPPSLEAFNAVDKEELKNYLKLQRERIEHLAFSFARPLAVFAKKTGILSFHDVEARLFNWQRIIAELDKYQNKKPENSVTELEKFILFELDEITPTNYGEKIQREDLVRKTGDLFLRKKQSLVRGIFQRSQVLASRSLQEMYRALGQQFNSRLAGRYPFAKNAGSKIYEEAQPDDIREFYEIFDTQAETLSAMLKNNRLFGDTGKQVLAFLNQMGVVRRLFTAYLEGGVKPEGFPAFANVTDAEGNMRQNAPTFDFDVQFRVNREHEISGNRIIDWQLASGDQIFRHSGEKRLGRWTYGDPIRVTLRWAKDAPDFPMFAGDQAGVLIDDKTVTYTYDNQWALIYMLSVHAATSEDFDRLTDPKPHTLKFSIRTRTDRENSGAAYAEMPETRVYMRMIVLTPGKKKQALVMPYFPFSAPELTTVSSGSRIDYREVTIPKTPKLETKISPEAMPGAPDND